MTGIEYIREKVIKTRCPGDFKLETEISLSCRADDRSKRELCELGNCEICWESELKKCDQFLGRI